MKQPWSYAIAGALMLSATLAGDAQAEKAARGTGAILRGLDKVSSEITDLELAVGEATSFGRLEIRLGECRYPANNPNADAYAQLVITDTVSGETKVNGWMIASSPALSALDDARYDVWVIACTR